MHGSSELFYLFFLLCVCVWGGGAAGQTPQLGLPSHQAPQTTRCQEAGPAAQQHWLQHAACPARSQMQRDCACLNSAAVEPCRTDVNQPASMQLQQAHKWCCSSRAAGVVRNVQLFQTKRRCSCRVAVYQQQVLQPATSSRSTWCCPAGTSACRSRGCSVCAVKTICMLLAGGSRIKYAIGLLQGGCIPQHITAGGTLPVAAAGRQRLLNAPQGVQSAAHWAQWAQQRAAASHTQPHTFWLLAYVLLSPVSSTRCS